MERHILHLKVPGFAVAVERVVDPALRTRPAAVCAGTGTRALVWAASPEARQEGVRKGITRAEAKRLCPGLAVVPPNPPLYRRASRALFDILVRRCPVVEPVRGGRIFLDMTGTARLMGPPLDSARAIRHEVLERLALDSVIGVAANKLVSRIAAKVSSRGAVLDVLPGSERSFLDPLDVHLLPAVRSLPDRAALTDLNLRRVRQVALIPPDRLAMVFGSVGRRLHMESRGVDPAPVRPPGREPAVIEEATLAEETNDLEILLGRLMLLAEEAGRKLRALGLVAGALDLRILYADRVEAKGRRRLKPPAALDSRLRGAARSLFEQVNFRRKRLRWMELALRRLEHIPAQLSLFPDAPEALREGALLAALDHLKSRYGDAVVRTGITG